MVTPTPTPTPQPHPAPGTPAPAPGAAPAAAAKPAGTTKEPKPPKAAKPKKEPSAAARPRLPKFPDEHVITVLKENAKARGANDRFKVYSTGMTVKQYVDKMTAEPWSRTSGQTYADMRWDEDHKFINIGPTVVPIPAQPAKEEASPPTQPAQPAPAQ